MRDLPLFLVVVSIVILGAVAAAPAQTDLGVGSGTHTSFASGGPAFPSLSARRVETPAPITPLRPDRTIINVSFDASITTNPNAAAIQAAVYNAVAYYQSQLNDPITVNILFRYSTTNPDGSAIDPGSLARSNWVFYVIAWNNFITNLRNDAKTSNDVIANASLPGTALSTNVRPASANGRAIGLNTPGVMTATGGVGGGNLDGIVTMNANQPFQFNRAGGIAPGSYDAQRSIEHEIDEVLGLGSFLNLTGTDLRPQDLFSWSAPGNRNLTTTGTRYFSIDGGSTNLVAFNQNPGGDFGDWFSATCPQAAPFPQNAFSCPGQFADVTRLTPEAINLDVIGYDLLTPARFDFDGDGRSDVSVYRPPTGLWYVNKSSGGQSIVNWGIATDKITPADYDGDGKTDIAVYRPSEGNWYIVNSATGSVRVVNFGNSSDVPDPADMDGDGKADVVIFRGSTGDWWINSSATGGVGAQHWGSNGDVPAAADYDADGRSDLAVFRPSNGAWYIQRSNGGITAIGWGVSSDKIAPADYNGDGRADIAVFRPSNGTWYILTDPATGAAIFRNWGTLGDIPVAADYDGDGKADVAIFRPSTGDWWVDQSASGLMAVHWGAPGDTPSPAAFGN